MADVYKAPFGTYAVTAGHSLDATGKADMATNFTNLKALFNPTSGASAAHPDFQKIAPAVRDAIVAEINAIAALVAAWA